MSNRGESGGTYTGLSVVVDLLAVDDNRELLADVSNADIDAITRVLEKLQSIFGMCQIPWRAS